MNKIKIEQPLWATILIVIIAALTLLLFGDMFFNCSVQKPPTPVMIATP